MSNDHDDSDTDTPQEPRIAEQIGEIGGEVGEGLGQAAEAMGEDDEAREVIETAGDVAEGASEIARAAQAGQDLAAAADAGDEARVAGAVGNLAGGVLGTAGAAVDGLAGAVPEDARGAVSTAAQVLRGAAGAARATEQVVAGIQQVERAILGRLAVFQTGADLSEEDRLVVEEAHGRQTLSDLYEFKIRVMHDNEGGLSDELIDELLVEPARLGLNREALGAGDVYGVLSRFEMLAMHGRRPTYYDLTLVPKLWRTTLVKRTRVFQQMTHLEVVLEVLHQHGFDPGTHVSDHTEETYPTHEYVVQYQETDFDFMRRLLAHNGIHFHLTQDPGTEALVLGDRNAAFTPVELADELVYHEHAFAPESDEPRVWDLRRIRQPRFGAVVVRDYNWRTPHHPLRAEQAADEATGYGFLDLFGEHFRDDAEGARLARVRAEEQLVEREVFVAKTALRGVRPGSYFDLVHHPNPDLNQRYLVISSDEQMDDGHTYVNEFRAIPFSVTYRPPRLVPWPRIDGLSNAIVDGEARSTDTPIDEQGRYRVVLPFDETAANGGRASRLVRRAQPSAGAGYGMHLPLHIGTEVAISHVNGDPDRPIIVGAVPNAAAGSPVVSDNAGQSRIRTGSGVVIELDDAC